MTEKLTREGFVPDPPPVVATDSPPEAPSPPPPPTPPLRPARVSMRGDDVVVRLIKNITDEDDKVRSELVLRTPSVRDIARYGDITNYSPTRVDDAGRPIIEIATDRAPAILANLAGTIPATILQMHPRDFMSACWAVAGFFLPHPDEVG